MTDQNQTPDQDQDDPKAGRDPRRISPVPPPDGEKPEPRDPPDDEKAAR